MEHHTSEIPLRIETVLLEKGMPRPYIPRLQSNFRIEKAFVRPNYAMVFDWLLGKGISVSVLLAETSDEKKWLPKVTGEVRFTGKEAFTSWEAAADQALGYVLENI